MINNIMTTPTDPKISDPIVFKYGLAHIKLTPNRRTAGDEHVKQPLTWRRKLINEDRDLTFIVTLKQNSSEATIAEPQIVFNKAGL